MKAKLLLVCLGMACQTGIAADPAAAEPRWFLDANGCKFLNPFPPNFPSLTIEWPGPCVDGFVSGTGEVRLAPGVSYRGEFARGRIVKGSVENDGEIYEGGFLDNIPHGQGTSRGPEGTVISAKYVRGMVDGTHVELTWPDGRRYRGEVDARTQQMHGKGILESADGGLYEGEFKLSLPDGVGVMKRPGGEIRSGTFVRGQLDGTGSILYSNQTRYEGGLRAGQPNGQGRMEFTDGTLYAGAFVAGQYQGNGKLTYADGSVYEGNFLAGDPSGGGKATSPDGRRYDGQFLYGKWNGQGRLTYASGETYEGEWKAGVLTGKCHIAQEQSVYDGECVDGKASGSGHLEDKTKALVYQGGFAKDRFEGRGSLRLGELAYEGMFKAGIMEGEGVLTSGKLKMRGDFKAGVLVRGTIAAEDGRTFEVDLEKDEVLEVLKDGTKRPVDQLPADITI